MKQKLAILMAVTALTCALSACSGTLGMDERGAYGNVSTTQDGTVNDGSDYRDEYAPYGRNYNGREYNTRNSTGTGMTGGR